MFNNLPSKSIIFIDSNIFIYHFLDMSENCTYLFKRTESEDITAYTSVIVVAEVLHRLMLIEAREKLNISEKNLLKHLKKHRNIVTTLEKYHIATEKIPEFGIKILSFGMNEILSSRYFRTKYGFLTNDSINLSIMKSNGIKNIATNDSDFDDVKEIKVWKP